MSPVVGVEGETEVRLVRATYNQDRIVDIYYPPGVDRFSLTPAVVFVNGNPEGQIQNQQGRPWMHSNQALGWCRLTAESGIIAVVFDNGWQPKENLTLLGDWLLTNAVNYGIDQNRIGVWTASNGCPVTLSAFRSGYEAIAGIKLSFGVFYYGWMLKQPDYDVSIPLLVVNAQNDEFVDAKEIERFVQEHLDKGGNVTLLTHATGRHGFDVSRDIPETREIISETLAFMRQSFDL